MHDAIQKWVLAFANQAQSISILMLLGGLAILAMATIFVMRGLAAAKSLSDELGGLSQELSGHARLKAILEAKSWPEKHAAFDPVRGALAATLKRGSGSSLDSAVRASANATMRRGSSVRVIASTLIILSLLATFAGMKGATNELTNALTPPSSAGQAQANTTAKDYDQFRKEVTGALGDMSRAFGANLQGIFFAAALLLLFQLLRYFQGELIERVRRLADEETRVAFSEGHQWVDRLAADLKNFVEDFRRENSLAIQESVKEAVDALGIHIRDLAEQTASMGSLQRETYEKAVQETHRASAAAWGGYLKEVSKAVESVVELQKQTLTLMQRDEARVETSARRAEAVGARLDAQLASLGTAIGGLGASSAASSAQVVAALREEGAATRARLAEVERAEPAGLLAESQG